LGGNGYISEFPQLSTKLYEIGAGDAEKSAAS